MRSPSVLMPRSARNASHGEPLPPALIRICRAALTRSVDPTMAPPMMSEWPPMYLVVECTTRSAPSASGLARAGDANVLSTTTVRPRACASSESAATSAMAVVGLLIVSSHSTRVWRPMALPTASASLVSTVRWPIPERARTARASPIVPPYTARGIRISSPLSTFASTAAWMAAMPEAVLSAASAPSRSARASSSAWCVGFE